MGWHYPWGLASGHTLVLHGFVVHESYVLCVLTNSVDLLTANHSSTLHSLSNPEERCWRKTAFFFILLLYLFHVQFTNTLSLFFCFVFFLPLITQQMFQRISLSSGPPRLQWSLHGSFLKAGLRTNAQWVHWREKIFKFSVIVMLY